MFDRFSKMRAWARSSHFVSQSRAIRIQFYADKLNQIRQVICQSEVKYEWKNKIGGGGVYLMREWAQILFFN